MIWPGPFSDVFARFTELLAPKHGWMFSITFLFGDPVQSLGIPNRVFVSICDLCFQILVFKAPGVGPHGVRLFRCLGTRRCGQRQERKERPGT